MKIQTIGLFFALLFIAGCKEGHHETAKNPLAVTKVPAASNTLPFSTPQETLTTLTREESAVFNIRIANALAEAPGSVDARKKLQPVTGDVIGVEAEQIQQEYDRNVAAADQKYRGNTILIRGRVSAVSASGTGYHVRFNVGPSENGMPRAEISSNDTGFLTELEKGTRITLACRGAGTSIGNALLTECVSSDSYARKKVADFLNRTPISDIANLSGWVRQELILAVAYASEMPENSECATSESFSPSCVSLVSTIGSSYGDKYSTSSDRMTSFAFKKLRINSW
jgi:hypothetical protein